jgi:hypothetical protein
MRARNDSLVAEVFAHVEEHYAEPISLKEVAVAAGLSQLPYHRAQGAHGPHRGGVWISKPLMAKTRRLLVEILLEGGARGGSSQAKRGILPGSRLDSTTARCAP